MCKRDPTLLRYASVITEQNKCWEFLAQHFDWFRTLRNNSQQPATTCNRVCKRKRHVTSNNVGSCGPTMLGVVGQQCCVRLHGALVIFLAFKTERLRV